MVHARPHLGRGAGLRQRVADTAFLDEERPAALRVGVGRTAARGRHREGDETQKGKQRSDQFRGAVHGAQCERESICRSYRQASRERPVLG
jgi:hypothetical protein